MAETLLTYNFHTICRAKVDGRAPRERLTDGRPVGDGGISQCRETAEGESAGPIVVRWQTGRCRDPPCFRGVTQHGVRSLKVDATAQLMAATLLLPRDLWDTLFVIEVRSLSRPRSNILLLEICHMFDSRSRRRQTLFLH